MAQNAGCGELLLISCLTLPRRVSSEVSRALGRALPWLGHGFGQTVQGQPRQDGFAAGRPELVQGRDAPIITHGIMTSSELMRAHLGGNQAQ